MKATFIALVVATAAAGAAQGPSRPAAAWPQWGGPTRDFKAPSVRLAASWPSSGPRELWSRTLGEGYSSVVSDGPTLYTMYRPVKGFVATVLGRFTGSTAEGEPEVVVALDAATGRTLWEHSYAAPILPRMNMEYGPGPHSTPLLAGGRVFAAGATGKLHALDARSGRVLWARDLWGEMGGQVQGRGYSCSPIAYGDTIVLTLGGRGQAVVALRQQDGAVAWKSGDFAPSPASPMLIQVGGQDQLVVFNADGVAGLDAQTGAVEWQHAHPTDYGLNISTPVWGADNLLFLSSAYGGGSRVLRLSRAGGRTSVQQVWSSSRMRVHFGNAIRLGDRVYGSSGDFGPAFFTAVDVQTGQVAWQERGLARASSLYADGRLVILDEDGTLALASPSATGLTIHSQVEALSGRCWTAPTLVGSMLFIRNRETIRALRLGAE